jgi:hypothetical protein
MQNLSISNNKFVEVVSFAVSLKNSSSNVPNNNIQLDRGISGNDEGVVGTITFMNQSAMIWIGWGKISIQDDDGKVVSQPQQINHQSRLGTGIPPMGPLVVATPKTEYKGMSSQNDKAAPCTQLVGGHNEEEMMIGWQMASRISKKIGWPIFVSCSLCSGMITMTDMMQSSSSNSSSRSVDFDAAEMNGYGPLDESSTVQLAAALAEKEVLRILTERKNSL